MIEVREAITKKELTEFVKFPFQLYKDSKNWVPPIITDEVESFNKNTNPVFETADAHFYIAYKNNKAVGRMAAIINWTEVEKQRIKKVRFGWWDVIDDVEVTKALLKKVEAFGEKNHLDYIEGPMGFSNMDKVGVMTEGFDHLGTMVTWYNFPYYKDHLEQLGYVIEKEYNESEFYLDDVNPKYFSKGSELVKKRYGVKGLNFTKTKDLMPYVDQMFALFNEAYANLSSFVSITDAQIAFYKKKYISFINPEYIKFVVDKDDNVIAFGIVMPGFAEALQKAKGKLFPFGFIHLLKAKKQSKSAVFYLVGIHPEYQNKGITAVLFNEFYKVFSEKGVNHFIRTPELSDNAAARNMWKHFNPQVFVMRRTYRKNL
ncbi:GNAT family N-acetyltransferase [Zhouia amylolytica]|uniref:GNAT family N-acetyltransferase n=1 Tax=Zhouia amylolytica TaxID=376730 RepID=UPI0020CDF005|nr:GNAT family N-acetyltransferase [Zhouia amylolytica]MCQ0112203.1 GNAT family N-acetyltransferase [Zhouia amylolytica]